MGWHCQRCGSGGTGEVRKCCEDEAVIAADQEARGLTKRYGTEALNAAASQRLMSAENAQWQRGMAGAAMGAARYLSQKLPAAQGKPLKPDVPPEEWKAKFIGEQKRACMLADQNGDLHSANRVLMIENCDLRRKLERLERKATPTGSKESP